MNEEHAILGVLIVVVVALAALLVFAIANLRATRELDGRVDDIDVRVARLEAQSLSAQEVRQFHERMASMEGQLRTNVELLTAIQKHLLGKER